MNYSEITDTEINARVAKKLDGITRVNLPIDGTTLFHAPKIQIKRNGKWEWFDPCNSWADAGPIIQENKIPLNPFRDAWAAGERRDVKSKNPLRAAMIAFLMMKDSGNG